MENKKTLTFMNYGSAFSLVIYFLYLGIYGMI